jgi:hypothetical protein
MFYTYRQEETFKYMVTTALLTRYTKLHTVAMRQHCKLDKAITQSTDSYKVTTVDVLLLWCSLK